MRSESKGNYPVVALRLRNITISRSKEQGTRSKEQEASRKKQEARRVK